MWMLDWVSEDCWDEDLSAHAVNILASSFRGLKVVGPKHELGRVPQVLRRRFQFPDNKITRIWPFPDSPSVMIEIKTGEQSRAAVILKSRDCMNEFIDKFFRIEAEWHLVDHLLHRRAYDEPSFQSLAGCALSACVLEHDSEPELTNIAMIRETLATMMNPEGHPTAELRPVANFDDTESLRIEAIDLSADARSGFVVTSRTCGVSKILVSAGSPKEVMFAPDPFTGDMISVSRCAIHHLGSESLLKVIRDYVRHCVIKEASGLRWMPEIEYRRLEQDTED